MGLTDVFSKIINAIKEVKTLLIAKIIEVGEDTGHADNIYSAVEEDWTLAKILGIYDDVGSYFTLLRRWAKAGTPELKEKILDELDEVTTDILNHYGFDEDGISQITVYLSTLTKLFDMRDEHIEVL